MCVIYILLAVPLKYEKLKRIFFFVESRIYLIMMKITPPVFYSFFSLYLKAVLHQVAISPLQSSLIVVSCCEQVLNKHLVCWHCRPVRFSTRQGCHSQVFQFLKSFQEKLVCNDRTLQEERPIMDLADCTWLSFAS